MKAQTRFERFKAVLYHQLGNRATPAEEMEAMQIGLEACLKLATFGDSIVREYWSDQAKRIEDILRRTRQAYADGP